MNKWPMISLGKMVLPVERPEVPVPGKPYRQVGVRLWGHHLPGIHENPVQFGGSRVDLTCAGEGSTAIYG
jgi:hypothetical protein